MFHGEKRGEGGRTDVSNLYMLNKAVLMLFTYKNGRV